jgi:hypothetical protein
MYSKGGTPSKSGYSGTPRNRSTRLGQSGLSFGKNEEASTFGEGSEDDLSNTPDRATKSKLIQVQAQYSRLQYDHSIIQENLKNAQAARQHAQHFSKNQLVSFLSPKFSMHWYTILSRHTQIMIRQALLPRVRKKDALLQELTQALRDESSDQNKVCFIET